MALNELLAQLQQNALTTKTRRDEAAATLSEATQRLALQAAQKRRGAGSNRSGGPGGTRASLTGGKITPGFKVGDMPAEGDVHRHNESKYSHTKFAADINVPGTGDFGNPVSAYKPGQVVAVKRLKDSYGKHIKIRHPDGTETLYAHLSGMRVRKGQRVKAGQMIGRVGNSGNSSGPHLHFEIS